MALSDLLQKIETDGKAQVAAVLADADTQAEAIKSSYAKRQNELRESFAKETEMLLQKQAKNSEERDVRMHKHIIAAAKRAAIDDVFMKTLAELESLDEKAYASFIEKQISGITSDLKGATIRTSEARFGLTRKVLKDLNIDVTCEGDAALGGGFVIVGKDFEYNFTFARLLEMNKAELEAEVAQTLFN